jgi:hypothetical protein
MAQLGDVTFNIAKGSYAGFGLDQAANVIPLLGGDPSLPRNNEVVQTSAMGARSASLDAVVLSSSDRDDLEDLLFTQTVFYDGDADHDVIVMQAKVRIPIYVGTSPDAWIVELVLREYNAVSS